MEEKTHFTNQFPTFKLSDESSVCFVLYIEKNGWEEIVFLIKKENLVLSIFLPFCYKLII